MPNKAFAQVKLVENMHLRGSNPQGLGVDMDARPGDPEAAGATPMEMLLQAMAGCTSMDVLNYLRKRRFEIEDYEIFVQGTKQDEPPKMYKHLQLTYRAKAKGLTVEEIEKAVKMSLEKYCSISIALKHTAKIEYKCEVID